MSNLISFAIAFLYRIILNVKENPKDNFDSFYILKLFQRVRIYLIHSIKLMKTSFYYFYYNFVLAVEPVTHV